MNKLIVYEGDDEVIVTSLEQEHEMLKLYFTEGGRDVEEYVRSEAKDGYVAMTYNIATNLDI